MGIKYFFGWLRKTFPSHIKTFSMCKNKSLKDDDISIDIDNFLVDMNGIFHYCCQKVYKYGSFKEKDEEKKEYNYKKKTNSLQKQKELLEMIGSYVDRLIRFVKPNRKVFLAIDGVAPLSKQCQQRSRRYRSAKENDDGIFDSNSITPGTKFLDNISRYMDWFIKNKMNDKSWGDIEVIFSSEKTPGEGEHKLVKFVRDCGDEKESYMIHGMDADLVMLSLATHFPNFHVLRENPYRYENEYFHIDMKSIREHLVNALLCDQSLLDDKIHINDFILMIFLTGNDFLPHLPTIEILEGGVENLFETYRNVSKNYGSLTNNVNTLNIKSLQVFLGTLGNIEKQFLENKRSVSINFPDTLLEKYTTLGIDGKYILDMEGYKKEYYAKKMNIHDEDGIKQACLEYIEGLQWVLSYYTTGVPHWKWYYPYYYAPFMSDIVTYLSDYVKPKYLINKNNKDNNPYPPFIQLMCVLPKKSKDILPSPLQELIYNKSMTKYYPDDLENLYIDLDGKHNSWEGVVILPHMDFSLLEKEYYKIQKNIDQKEMKRNINGKNFIYRYNENEDYTLKSFYGDIKNCKITYTFF